MSERVAAGGGGIAVAGPAGEMRYDELHEAAARVARALARALPETSGARVCLLAPPGPLFAASLLGTWRVGAIAVPLALSHPLPELRRVIEDAGAIAVVAAGGELAARVEPACQPAGRRVLRAEALLASGEGPARGPAEGEEAALLLYTSGTTGRPKGALHTHASLAAQVATLVEAWEWSAADRILHVLPLHHTHGLVNAFLCALWAGGTCEMASGFDAESVWDRWVAGGITLFMAVPTVYHRLLSAWEWAGADERVRRSHAARGLRLMVSGSAALPSRIFERWHQVSGHTLLERYGMTETGMLLSNPLRGERRPGTVGVPLPGVETRRVDDGGRLVRGPEAGEVEVRTPGLFREYWGRPEETTAAFRDGWFRTGDVAVVEDGYWRLLGRTSVDIIKTGGYKISALEVEETLREHPDVEECAVVGVPDREWGERVCAAVVPRPGRSPDAETLRRWARERLAPYKTPSRWLAVGELPRNAMGKVAKRRVRALFETG